MKPRRIITRITCYLLMLLYTVGLMVKPLSFCLVSKKLTDFRSFLTDTLSSKFATVIINIAYHTRLKRFVIRSTVLRNIDVAFKYQQEMF